MTLCVRIISKTQIGFERLKRRKISFFGIKEEDLKRLVLTNYLLILVEGIFAVFVSLKYQIPPLAVIIEVVLAILAVNLLLHLLLMIKAPPLIKESGLLFLELVVIVGLTIIIYYFHEERPSLLLLYIPSIIFSATQSLSFGITNVVAIIIAFGTLTILENLNLSFLPYSLPLSEMSTSLKAGIMFSFFLLMILSFLANYFMEVLRNREKQIRNLAELNKKLYQRSKTTSDEIVKNMKEGLLVVDHDSKIVKFNRAFASMVAEKEDLTGLDIEKLPLSFAPRLQAYLRHILKENIRNFGFKAEDQFKHIYNIMISEIELKKGENGYLIILEREPVPWGIVFDSENKKPIDLAVVRLHNAENDRIMETKVTDSDGRFGFIVPEGKYYISVIKSGYIFPSKKSSEGYKGEKFTSEESLLRLNIPLDRN